MKEKIYSYNGKRVIIVSEDFCKKWEIFARLKVEKEDYVVKRWERMKLKGWVEKEKLIN